MYFASGFAALLAVKCAGIERRRHFGLLVR